MQKLRTAVVGAGKMGAIHSKVYSQLAQSEFIGVVDVDAAKAGKLAEQYNVKSFASVADIIGKVDAVTIAAPTTYHLALAEPLLKAKIPVLIEKPLAASVEQAKRIVELANENGVIVAVGHSERCNPVVQAMKKFNIEPRFIESNRISPYPFRSMDIGVVLDVMIHDIDIILSLAASKLKRVDAVGVNVIGDNEDICNARLTFENGCIANVTASRLAFKTERKVRVFSKQAYLSLDYFKKEGVVVRADPNIDAVKWIKEHQEQGDFDFSAINWNELVHMEKLDIGNKEPLRLEQESFLNAISDTSKRPEVTADEGLAAMECAEAILEAIKKHKWE